MIDLQPFCSTDPARPYLHQPFSRGEWTYATDGHVLVRVPRRPDIDENAKAPHAERVVEGYPLLSDLIPLPAIPLLGPEYVECRTCQGRCTQHDCPDCSHDCKACDGKGEIEALVSVAIGPAVFGVPLLRLVAALPGVRIPAAPVPGKPMRFLFDGGEGLIAARRVPAERHIPEPVR